MLFRLRITPKVTGGDSRPIDGLLGATRKNATQLEDGIMLEDAIDMAVQHQNTMTAAEKVSAEIQAEIDRAVRKFPTWPTDPLHAMAVLGEEYGELNKAVLQLTYEPQKTGSSLQEVRNEAIQTAAMAFRFVMSLDRYKYGECEQHHQSA